jgi:hypothetical protein
MSNEYADPSGNTEQFKAFVHAPAPEPARSRTPLVVGAAVAAVVLVALVAFLLLG